MHFNVRLLANMEGLSRLYLPAYVPASAILVHEARKSPIISLINDPGQWPNVRCRFEDRAEFGLDRVWIRKAKDENGHLAQQRAEKMVDVLNSSLSLPFTGF